MSLEEIKMDVTRRVHKEYKDFIEDSMKKGKWYLIDNATKVAFYKEIHIYVLNGMVEDSQYKEMVLMKDIIKELWNRFEKNSVSKKNDHFLYQLLEFHNKNKSVIKRTLRLKEGLDA